MGPSLTADARCRFVQGDFFAMSHGEGYDPSFPGRLFDAVLLDIDHSPTHVLDDGSAGFYGIDGMRAVASHLRPGGVYAMWSNDPPDAAYIAILESVFERGHGRGHHLPQPPAGQGRDRDRVRRERGLGAARRALGTSGPRPRLHAI